MRKLYGINGKARSWSPALILHPIDFSVVYRNNLCTRPTRNRSKTVSQASLAPCCGE